MSKGGVGNGPAGDVPRDHWWNAWVAPATLLTLAAAVGTLGYALIYRVPDIEKRLESILSEQKLRSTAWELNQGKRFDRIDKYLAGIKRNLIRLCARGKQIDKDCDITDLAEAIDSLTAEEARLFSSVKFIKLSGDSPIFNSAALEAKFRARGHVLIDAPNVSSAQLAEVMTLLTGAKQAKWSTEDEMVIVKFVNGSAVFTPARGVTTAAIAETVASLNAVTAVNEALSTSGQVARKD